ncbi:MAG TPA: biotin carboxylase N-terminal domain-containing protein [Beijerinckiaceae bacterium]|jgi:3-methylcrotonyl-CoA carboxylase alpha subunit
MLDSVLIANRGEIACRIIRTAKWLGMRTVAVYSEADAKAPFVRMADEAHLIGPAPARESYLDIDKIVAAAKTSGAACVHPGYGFLSERAEFAEACAAAGVVFVGPPPAAIRAMGLKDAAKALVGKAGVPVVPGYHGARQEPDFLTQEAGKIGFPVLIKAVAGGGGKGMRRVEDPKEFAAALESAQREAQSAFGDPRVLVEKYVLAPRHVEIQVFADAHGNVVHLFERDCSLQRRHQKVIEEAPAPGMTDEVRAAMGRAAVEAARAVGYAGAGTVEFIADGREGLRADRFWFMEMNTRLQVEHPVTEAVTGLDLVELQFRVAAGEPLPFGQDDLAIDGHAVEARLYAEDPEKGFLPSTGRLWALRFPEGEGVRIDAGVVEGDAVTPFYDPMIAKVIAHAPTRDEALDRLSAALGETLVAGPRTNLAFLRALADAPEFRASRFDTGFIDRNLEGLGAAPQPLDEEAARLGALMLVDDEWEELEARRASLSPAEGLHSPWAERDAFQLGPPRRHGLSVTVEGERRDMAVTWAADGPEVAFGTGVSRFTPEHFTGNDRAFPRTDTGVIVLRGGRQTRVDRHDPFAVDLEHMDEGGTVKAPMHGKLVAIFVRPGDKVEKGQRLAVVEAMKMEHALVAPAAGEVAEVAAEAGAQVAEGARLIVIKTENGAGG